MNILGLEPFIPNENRRSLMELRDSLGEKKYVAHIWRARSKERLQELPWRACRTKSRGEYPIVRDAGRTSGIVQMRRAGK